MVYIPFVPVLQLSKAGKILKMVPHPLQDSTEWSGGDFPLKIHPPTSRGTRGTRWKGFEKCRFIRQHLSKKADVSP